MKKTIIDKLEKTRPRRTPREQYLANWNALHNSYLPPDIDGYACPTCRGLTVSKADICRTCKGTGLVPIAVVEAEYQKEIKTVRLRQAAWRRKEKRLQVALKKLSPADLKLISELVGHQTWC